MSGETNWKLKYTELKAKYMNAVDVAFRLGVEEGMKQSQVDQANQQMQQAQAQQEQMMGGGGDPGAGQEDPSQNNNGAPGVPDQGGGADKSGAPSVQPNPVSENPEGSELDQHIAKLESMVAKSEVPVEDLKKSLDELRWISTNLKQQAELKKSAQAIPAIAKALHKPQFKFGVNATHNLNNTAKAAATMHHKIVNDVMAKWESEEKKAGRDILSTLNIEGITKGE